ncbi:hypothetical protein Ciccas_001776 [Cichlidogyrus casuarinus]|uniref:Uncharacterized protein n=1 Tax=Cichlidogyrus casuarinus TaxID=1844966 RepID=A0ABD2QJ21_9PLAT
MESRFVFILVLSVILNQRSLLADAYHTNNLYSYESVAKIIGSDTELSTSAEILATSYEIGGINDAGALPRFRKILLHINLIDTSSEIVQALAIRGSDGAIDRFFVAEAFKNNSNLLNKVKGFLTIMAINPHLLPAQEVDIHGKCHTSYKLDAITSDESLLIDKIKRDCEPLHRKMGEYDKSLAVGSLVSFDQKIDTKYWIEKNKGTLMRAKVNSSLFIRNPFPMLMKEQELILLHGSEHLELKQLVRQDDVGTFIKFNRTIIELKPASLIEASPTFRLGIPQNQSQHSSKNRSSL